MNKNEGLYLLYGTERYDIKQYVKKLQKDFGQCELGINYFILDKENVSTLARVCEGVSFLGAKKFVVVKDTGLSFDPKVLDSLVDDMCIIVIIEENIDKRTVTYKYLSQKAKCVEFNILSEAQAVMYVIEKLKELNLKIDNATAVYMVNTCSVDKMNLTNECYKLSYYVKNSVVTQLDIDTVCVKTFEAKMYDVLDKIVYDVNKKNIIDEMDMLVSQDEYIGLLGVMVFKQFKQAYCIKILQERQIKNNDIIQRLKMTPYIFNKIYNICKKYTKGQIEEILQKLCKYDYEGKVGLNDLVIGLKQVILEM